MLAVCSKYSKDPSVIRRLTFAASFYPCSLPNYWQIVHSFCVAGKEERSTLTVQDAQMLVENQSSLDKDAYAYDQALTAEILQFKRQGSDVPLGVVLISGEKRVPPM